MVPRGKQARAAVLTLAIAACAGRALAAEPPPEVSYRMQLAIDPETGVIVGEGDVALVNSSAAPLDKVPLVLYPNRFEAIDPRITDVNFGRYYSYGFHPGSLKIERVTAPGETPLDLEVPESPVLPPGTYALVKLAKPVAPGETARFSVRFTTRVPDRFGMFGRRGERLILEGGYFPAVPARERTGAFAPGLGPMSGLIDVTATTSKGEVLLGQDPASKGPVRAVATGRCLFLGAGEDLGVVVRRPANEQMLAPEVVFHGPAGDEERATRICGLVQEAATRFRTAWLPPGERVEPIVVVLAPLRDRLVHATDVLLASDRLFEILPYFDSFHEREVARGTFELLARRSRTLDRLEAADAGWVAEAMGWVAVCEWDAARLGLKGQELRSGLGYLDWIPFIDSNIRAPRFASSDLYLGQLYEPRDAVRDERERFGSARPRGRVVAEKLRDKLGAAKLHALARATLGSNGADGSHLRERASKLAQEDLTGFFDLWLGAAPRENLAIDSRGPATLPDGSDGVAVGVRRDTEDARLGKVGEPVVVEAHSGGETDRQVWDGKGDRAILIFPRRALFYSITMDPEGRIDEAYKGDDFYPSIAKVLLNRFDLSIDLNGGNTSEVGLGFTIHPFYDYSQSIFVDAFASATATGGRVAYAYHFGEEITEILFANSVGGGMTLEKVAPGLLRGARTTITESDGTLAFYSIGYSLDTRVTGIQPTHGFHLGVGADVSSKQYGGGDFTYEKVSGNAIYLFTPFRPFTFAFEALAGNIFDTNPPSQQLFDAGGEDSVRGVRTGDFVDRAIFVAKGELRVSVLEDLDQGVLKLFWLRRVELAGFSDAGDVGPRVDKIFRSPGKWKWGAGGGIRCEIDALGIEPLLVRFDIAWRCDRGPGIDKGVPQYYLGVDQSF
jgi:hypothetical protein